MSWTWATARSRTAARRTRCRSGPARAGTSCATWTRPTRSVRRPRGRAVLDGPAGRRPHRRRRPVRRRRRARGAAPAVRPVLAQGAVRPGPRVEQRAVPPAVQPGDDPGVRLHRRARRLRRGRDVVHGDIVDGAVVLLRRPAGQPRVRQDRQEPEEHGHARRDLRRVRRRHLPAVRDVDGPAGGVAAVGDPSGRRLAAVPAAAVAQRRRRGDRRAARRRASRRRGDAAAAAPDDRRRAERHGRAALQHRHRQADRAEQPRRPSAASCTARRPRRWC